MLLPITFFKKNTDYNGRNWPGVVVLKEDHPYRAAIWAQEAYEARHKLNPINFWKTRGDSGAREMEVFSHEIEAQAAEIVYGLNIEEYRRKEANDLLDKYSDILDGMSHEDVVTAMKAVSVKARIWVINNLGEIAKKKKKA